MRKILLLLLISYSCFGQRQAMECSIYCNKWVSACGATSLSTRPAIRDIRNVNQWMNGEEAFGQIGNTTWIMDFACTNSTNALVSLVGAFPSGTNVNSAVHVADSGYRSTSLTNYIIAPAMNATTSLNNQFFMIYFQNSTKFAENGAGFFSGSSTNLVNYRLTTALVGYINDNTGETYSGTFTYPMMSFLYRSSSTVCGAYYNGTSLGTTTASSTIVNNSTQYAYLGCFNNNGTPSNYGTDMKSCASMGTYSGINVPQYFRDCSYFTRP